MSIYSIGSVPSFLPASSAHITEATMGMQGEQARLEGLERAIGSAECPVALKEATQAFESFFLQIMFREMRRTVPEPAENSVFERSHAERVFREMLDEEMAIMAANNGGIGLSAFMFRQMQREGLVLMPANDNQRF